MTTYAVTVSSGTGRVLILAEGERRKLAVMSLARMSGRTVISVSVRS